MPISRIEFMWLVASGAVTLLLFATLRPDVTHAVKNDANMQCPPGGQKGQPCKDNTNGYITNGKCKFIYFCTATDYDKNPPSKCDGAVGSQNCPVGKPYAASPTKQTQNGTSPANTRRNASSTPRIRIPGKTISEIEENMLNVAFASLTDASRNIGPAVLSESGNAALLALLNISEEEAEEAGLLTYAPESFDEHTSTLYESLRDSAIRLSTENAYKSGTIEPLTESNTLVFISGGQKSVTLYPVRGLDEENLLTSRAGWSAFSVYLFANVSNWIGSFLSALVHLISALGNILIADFPAARAHLDAALADFRNGYAGLGRALGAIGTQALHIRLW